MTETRKEIVARLQRIAMEEFTERTEPEARDAVREVCDILFAEGYTLAIMSELGGFVRWRSSWEDLAPDLSFDIGHGTKIRPINVGRVQKDTGLRHNVGTFYVNWKGGSDAVMMLCPRTLDIVRSHREKIDALPKA